MVKQYFAKQRGEIYVRVRRQINLCIIKRKVPPYFSLFYMDVQHAVLLKASPLGPPANPRGTLFSIETMQFTVPNAGTSSFRGL